MAQLTEYAEYLSKEIGPRPAGTEEEQQAALYITERFQKDAGFPAQIEEFSGTSNIEGISAIPGLVVIVVAILGMIFPVLAIPAFVLAAVAAALYTLEALGKPVVTRRLARGASQNVVAKYEPNAESERSERGRSRSRKIVLIAHYDSGKVTPGLVRKIESLGFPVGLICVCGIIAAAFFLLLHVFVNAGAGAVVINVLTVISLIVCAYPVLRAALYRGAPYNEGANNNATGAAALLEAARRISRGSVSEADLASDASSISIHGELAARQSGLVPEGAQIVYEAERLVPPSELGEYDDEERLLAAKAAIAAMTGKPVERRAYGSVANNLVNSRAQGEEPSFELPADEPKAAVSEEAPVAPKEAPVVELAQRPAAQEEPKKPGFAPTPDLPAAPTEDEALPGYDNAPSWFVAAQKNAKKPSGDTAPIQRSRYTEAIETAEREAAERERLREEEQRREREAELKAREEAARAAIEQSVQASQSAASSNDPATAKPVYDEFAESLGSTTAFVPVSARNLVSEPAGDDAQDAPRKRRTDGRLAALPDINSEEPAPEQAPDQPQAASPSRSGMFRKLRADVPSMSGVIRMQQAGQDVSQQPGELPALPQPEAAEGVDYDMSVSDPDGFDGHGDYDVPAEYEEYGDFGQPAYEEPAFEEDNQVDMPKSRAGGFFGRFRRKGREKLDETPQEWLDVDDDFDARTVGRERGGWESFRNDTPDERGDYSSRRKWEGGSFSRVRLGRVDTRSGAGDEPVLAEDAFMDDDARQFADEIEQIYHFRNPLYSTDVWFVALGSECLAHDGVKAFIAEHGDDLRGAMIIEVESLGAGELCVAGTEGRIRPMTASSRAKRYTRAASTATGIVPGSVSLAGSDSATSILLSEGYQAMHLLGVENGAPALKGSADDVMENVDDLLLDDNVNFIMELLKK